MNERRSQLLILRYSGLSYKEIADILGLFTHIHWTAAGRELNVNSKRAIWHFAQEKYEGTSNRRRLACILDGELDESLLRHLDAALNAAGI
jgi:hypothetical protein